MRKHNYLTVLFFLLCTISVLGQEKISYTEVISVDSASKSELYNRAKIWFVNVFVSADDVLQLDDKGGGMIIGKAAMIFRQSFLAGSDGTNGHIRYAVKIFLKEGRYKYEITDFVHDPANLQYGNFSMGLITDSEIPPEGKGSDKWRTRVWNDLKAAIEIEAPPIVESLKNGMMTPTESSNDDW